jgi:hypothetical protein
MKHLLVLTPSLGRVSIGYRDAFARLMLECHRREIKLSVCDATDPGQLVHARNVLLAAAVDSDADRVFWWDADVCFDVELLFELVDRPEAMICRPYPMRAVDWPALRNYVDDLAVRDHCVASAEALRKFAQRWTTMLIYVDGKPVWSVDKRLVKVSHCGFGWVLMGGKALRHFAADECRIAETDWRMRKVARAFDLGRTGELVTMGEDVSFCARWRRHCADIWAAPFGHVQNGDHGGSFADYLGAHGLLP